MDWGSRFGPSSYCLAIETPMTNRVVYPGGSMQTTRSARNGDCFEMGCANGVYHIDVLGQSVVCDDRQLTIWLPDVFPNFVSGGIKCPQKEPVCLTSGCPIDCSGHGWCREGTCYCHLGYTGEIARSLHTSASALYTRDRLFDAAV